MPTEARANRLRQVAAQRQRGLTVVIEDVVDPHNLGAIARSCDAFGIQDIHVIFGPGTRFDPKAAGKNSSTATNKWLRYHLHDDTESALEMLKRDGWQLAATALEPAATPIYEANLAQDKLALLFGNEQTGLSSTAIKLADQLVTVPMLGIAQSMNVSVTAALAMYEVTKQRRAQRPHLLRATADEAARTLAYFQEMHEHLKRRNKVQRKQQARQRLKKSTPSTGPLPRINREGER